ncbi:MAG: cbb3-type cytochrome c oxidase subunit 3 [Gammaproteobacteria bacterium]
MTWFLFVGDMLVTAFMIALFVWLSLKGTRGYFDAASRIPLEDEEGRG